MATSQRNGHGINTVRVLSIVSGGVRGAAGPITKAGQKQADERSLSLSGTGSPKPGFGLGCPRVDRAGELLDFFFYSGRAREADGDAWANLSDRDGHWGAPGSVLCLLSRPAFSTR